MAKMTNEDEMRDTLDQTAQSIADMYDNPSSWSSWLVYLLGRLESQAKTNPAHTDSFQDMLASLQDQIRNRLKTGGW